MNRLIASLISGLIVVAPSASAARAQETPALTVEQVRDTFQHSGYDTDEPIYWDSSALTTFFVRDGGFDERILLVLVYPDVQSAEDGHRAAHADEDLERGESAALSDDRGPRLMPGYGRSAWWHNVAVVQALRIAAAAEGEAEPITTTGSRRFELATMPVVDEDFVQTLRSVAAQVQEQRF